MPQLALLRKEYLEREFQLLFPDLNQLVAIAAASAVSTLVALLVAAPLEVLTARAMAAAGGAPGKEGPYWGLGVLGGLLERLGLRTVPELYEEYWLLVGKELGFVIAKFLVFDSLREAVLFLVPAFAESESLLVACACGAIAGAVAAVVSHPIDTIFALRATGNDISSFADLPSLEQLFRGVGARVIIYSPGIAVTFLVYDVIKATLGVGSSGLMQTVDVLQPLH